MDEQDVSAQILSVELPASRPTVIVIGNGFVIQIQRNDDGSVDLHVGPASDMPVPFPFLAPASSNGTET